VVAKFDFGADVAAWFDFGSDVDAIFYNIHKRGKKDSHQKMTIGRERNLVRDMNAIN